MIASAKPRAPSNEPQAVHTLPIERISRKMSLIVHQTAQSYCSLYMDDGQLIWLLQILVLLIDIYYLHFPSVLRSWSEFDGNEEFENFLCQKRTQSSRSRDISCQASSLLFLFLTSHSVGQRRKGFKIVGDILECSSKAGQNMSG